MELIAQKMTNEQFGAIVSQYERLVYTICFQFTKDHQTAEDLVQETFLSAYLHKEDCPPESCRPWLARIASNKAKDYLRSAYHRRVQATEDEVLAGTAELPQAQRPEEIAVSQDEAQYIRGMVQALREPYHKVAVLFFLQERTPEEIARVLGRPEKTVRTQLYRAKRMLKEQLEERRKQHGIVSGIGLSDR